MLQLTEAAVKIMVSLVYRGHLTRNDWLTVSDDCLAQAFGKCECWNWMKLGQSLKSSGKLTMVKPLAFHLMDGLSYIADNGKVTGWEFLRSLQWMASKSGI